MLMLVNGTAIPARLLSGADVGVTTFSFHGRAILVIAEGLELDALPLREIHDPTSLIDVQEAPRRRTLTVAAG